MSSLRLLMSVLVSAAMLAACAAESEPPAAMATAEVNPVTGEGLPNPNPTRIGSWATLPEGREWGSTAGLDIDLTAYALVFVESTEPHPVVVVELSGSFLDRGAALAHKALTTYRHCLDTGRWPAYDDFLTLHPPRWAPTAQDITATTEGTHAA